MIVQVSDGYQVRCVDSMNWQVFELKSVAKRDGNRKPTGEYAEEWVPLPSYHSDLGSAVEWIAGRAMKAKDKALKRDLSGFLDDYRKIQKSIAKSASEFSKAYRGAE